MFQTSLKNIIININSAIDKRQSILEMTSIKERLESLYALIQSEIEIIKVEQKIKSRIEGQIEKNQKEYYLNEQMNAIQKELGDKDSKSEIFDLEKESDYQIIARDTDLFLRLNKNHIAIDESQLHPKLFPALRVAIDNDRNKKGRFVLTGSSSPELIKSISESLAGRVGLIELSPFLIMIINTTINFIIIPVFIKHNEFLIF